MPTIHFLNVKEGDCSISEHYSGHKTVIDVCNAQLADPVAEAQMAAIAKAERGITGDVQQKNYPLPGEPHQLHARPQHQQHFPVRPDAPGHGPHGG